MKKIFTLILVALLPLFANAQDYYYIEHEGFYYNLYLDGYTAEIVGDHISGELFLMDETIYYNGDNFTVTSVGNNAFEDCTELTYVQLPSTVTTIGDNAFKGCYNLSSFPIPSNLAYLGESAFEGCSNASGLTLPGTLKSIGSSAFADCTGITWLTINNGVESIGSYAFQNCSNITWTVFPSSLTTIGVSAFWGCGLMWVSIPENVTSIGWGAFQGCPLYNISVSENNNVYDSRNKCCAIIKTSTNTLVAGCYNTSIPNDVSEIGWFAFAEVSDLTSITIPENVTNIGFGAFTRTGLTSITIPESVTSMEDDIFWGCHSLVSATINATISDLHYYFFGDCPLLNTVSLPECLETIKGYAFQDCISLTSITIPGNVTSIDDRAFLGCSNLTSVKVDIVVPLTITSNTFPNRANATLTVPYGCKAVYEAADYWKEFKEIVEEEMPEKDDITIGSTGYATYCSRYPLDFSEVSGMKAYIASGFSPSTGKLVLTNVTEVPAGEGLYLVGEAGTYEVATSETDMMYSNLLKGVTSATTIYPTDGSYTNFILANGKHGVAFYTISEAGELAAGKAYLQLPTASVSEVKAISVIFDDDDEDGISSPTSEPSRNGEEIYNLQGQRVDKAQKGIFIVNGKKIFIK